MKLNKSLRIVAVSAFSFVLSFGSAVSASTVTISENSVFAGASAILSSYLSISKGISISDEKDESAGDYRLYSLTEELPLDDEVMVDMTASFDSLDDVYGEQEGEDSEETGVVDETYGYTVLGVANVENFLNVRKDASTDAELVGKMPAGAGCEIIEELDGWYHIKSGKVDGYVSAEFLATGDEAKTLAEEYVQTIATVVTESLRVRDEPNTDCKIDTLVPEGEELLVIEDMGEWIKVDMDDYEAYVASEFVEVGPKLPHASTIKELNYGKGVSDTRVDLVQYALQFVGNRYVWGGTSLTNGIDCSGFSMQILGRYGVSLPHSSRAQSGMGRKVDGSSIQPGDLVFYGSGGRVNHVAIYIGNGQIVHASNKRDGIKISNMYYRNPITMRSFL